MIPVSFNGKSFKLTPGKHHELIRDILHNFAPRFAKGAEVLYIGDTGQKEDFFDIKKIRQLGIQVDKHSKWPDVILYLSEKNWLFFIESVTSHGPVDNTRIIELNDLVKNSTAKTIYISAFPDRKTFHKFLKEISWETEVWIADSPTHMIHFNGYRFLGPYN
ncbi:MAG: BsuBI/PstI family type II restriction endonuclease [Salinispira sp.]